ncbi:hypothetical protein LUZ60_004488 [Juncus effusus]|nr:hypothetical protein LUZ60_004488 [Juncus effusus]
MTQTVLFNKKQFSRGFDSGSLTMAGNKHKRHSSAESEGLISSPVHVDSEDSSAPKRKCISLNRGGFEGFDVPIEVFKLSKLSSFERKSLESKLRLEVGKIQALQRKLLSVNSNMKQVHAPVKQNQNLNRAASGRFNTSHLMIMKQCETLLNRLMQQKIAKMLFNSPVDVVALKIPDYFDIIKNPMDLGTIKSKLASGAYTTAWNFLSDVRLTFTNATTYNPPTNDVHVMAITLSKFFETRWKPIEKKLVQADEEEQRENEEASRRSNPVPVPATSNPVPAAQPKKKRTLMVTESSPVVIERIKPRMTADERTNLGDRLASVSDELPVYIIEYLKTCCNNGEQSGEAEMEIDIDLLDDEMMFELQKLLDRYMVEKEEGRNEKNDTCEVEVLNVSGVSNSSTHPNKVGEPMEEDVDICGEDPPGTSYPPVVIEKEIQERGSKCSTSSSSSDSASSDSGSSSSSGSESRGRAANPSKNSKENARSELPLEQENSDVISSLDRPISGLTVPDQDAQSKPESVGGNSNPEGESERQASPEKLYRAALLRSRFADTIVKAHEKLLTQDEKGDPEKLRREKEALERQQREEKARILAEAKKVEEARKRAEAEAEAEAKRKRELEREAAREAARQALLNMEKTVEINDTVMMRELEMLRNAAPAENIVSSVDETSPDNSPDGLPDFMRAGSGNPLEQLGLFMKVDDEEEEEEEETLDQQQPKSKTPVNDTEEGEID